MQYREISPVAQQSSCWLPVERILPRASLCGLQTEGDLHALMAQIHQEGLRRPVLVRPITQGRYVIVSGNRRLLACRRLGLTHIQAVVLPPLNVNAATGSPAEGAAGATPSQRELLSALSTHCYHYLDEAAVMRQLHMGHGMSRAAIAQAMGMTPQAVADRMALLALEEPLRAFLMEEGAPEGVARVLMKLPPGEERMAVAARAAREKLCIRDVEAMVTALATRLPKERARPEGKAGVPPARRVVTLMRDTRPYVNAIRDIAQQMRQAGVPATLTESAAGEEWALTLRFREHRHQVRHRRADRHVGQSM